MREVEGELQAAGADLTLIGSGKVRYARAFQEELGFRARLLSDPARVTFAAAGLERGIGKTFSLGSLLGGMRAYRSGHRQSGVHGDLWQQGGVVVVAPGGPVLLHHVSQFVGDHVANRILLQVVRGG